MSDNYFVEYLGYGLSVIPVKNKICLLSSWKPYQEAPAHAQEAAAWPSTDIACVCGKVSGGLVALDFDVKNGNQWEA